ncbi:hypothetical protein K502DRAFT_229642 [Neoconidiobolus thromboides FSU 785]|nr:hypothetical protein K502DRAFT_229642 [Neoconidiobolus thromboides FSU 785]
MELDSYEIAIHAYSIAIIVPTLIFNLIVFYLIFKQKWDNNLIERNVILFIVISDIIFSASIVIKYIVGFSNDLNVFKIQTNGSNFNSSDCNLSGFLLMITMHSTTYMLGVLSYVRYNSIVTQSNNISYLKFSIILLPVVIIISCAIYGLANSLFVEMPGGLACHIWSPHLNDLKRTPIQILMAYNIVFSLIMITIFYIKIALFHRNCLKSYLNRPSITVLRANRKKISYPHPCELEELKLEKEVIQLSGAETFSKISKIERMKHQGYIVAYRILIILLIIYICYTPELLLEQMEILMGWTRTRVLDGICTHFRSGYGLANALLLLLLHTKTRKEFIVLIKRLGGKNLEQPTCNMTWKDKIRASFKNRMR